jgi:alkanesulfonate monooxygenase SsuD/methylene tetrahydromethanopterin reductase-like flavin-dependent oxidoreductase (luciferase family)
MWDPLRLVEDYAMPDILTGGRVIFGVGRRYHTREVETFGAPLLSCDTGDHRLAAITLRRVRCYVPRNTTRASTAFTP